MNHELTNFKNDTNLRLNYITIRLIRKIRKFVAQ